MIIVIEGTDGCGKKTQTELLANYLTSLGKKCLRISFPNYESKSSAPVQMYLAGEFGDSNSLGSYQASVLYAVDRMLTMHKINVEDYDYIILDRYASSNMLYHSRNMNKKELDKFLDWVEDFEFKTLGIPKPDLTIFLDVPVEFSVKLMYEREVVDGRIKGDILEKENIQREIYARAKYVARRQGWETVRCVQNGKMLTKELVQEKIKRIIDNGY